MDMNLVKLIEKFRSEDACREYLEHLRWPHGVICPKCDDVRISRIHDRGQFECSVCRYQFSVRVGTIFQGSHLPLWKWFIAIYLIIESKKGISANQLKRNLGVSYKTAWYLCHRIRAAMVDESAKLLKGIVEVDETWIGGKQDGVGSGNKEKKTMVVGAVQRGGKIRLQVIKSNDRKTLHKFINENTAPDTEAIYTDDWRVYRGIEDEDTKHKTVNHSKKEWVHGDVHTNTVENIWSLLKRSIIGSYHKVSTKHLEAYLDELEWRYNNRDNPWLFRDTLMKLISSEVLEYKELTA
jgi:transposase-like protein